MYKGFSRLLSTSFLNLEIRISAVRPLLRNNIKLRFTSIFVVVFLLSISNLVSGQQTQTEAGSLIAEAKSLIGKREPERALATIQKAISLDPRNPVAHVQLAIIYSTLENDEKARLAVAEALKLDPNYAPAHQQRAAQLRRAKDYEGAIREAKLALSLKPDASLRQMRTSLLA